jgi:hypothetical protein
MDQTERSQQPYPWMGAQPDDPFIISRLKLEPAFHLLDLPVESLKQQQPFISLMGESWREP